MPNKIELNRFTLAELQRFARNAKPPVQAVQQYNKRELVDIMVSERHRAKFHDLRGERFPYKKVAKAEVKKYPYKKKANVKAGNRPRENKGGCKVGRVGESPKGGCKIGKRNPSTKEKTVAILAREKAKARGNKRVPYRKK